MRGPVARRVATRATQIQKLAPGTRYAPTGDVPDTLLDHLQRTHRVEQAKREEAWTRELDVRRRECEERARIDIAALRIKLAI